MRSSILSVLPEAEKYNIEILFETALPPDDFRSFLEGFSHPSIGANFDTGNSASLGYHPNYEIRTLGPFIRNIHIKDRIYGGGTVPLGKGNADFVKIFQSLSEIEYQGDFILQTARDPDHVGVAVKYQSMVSEWISRFLEKEKINHHPL